jgi:hypothetical protein
VCVGRTACSAQQPDPQIRLIRDNPPLLRSTEQLGGFSPRLDARPMGEEWPSDVRPGQGYERGFAVGGSRLFSRR